MAEIIVDPKLLETLKMEQARLLVEWQRLTTTIEVLERAAADQAHAAIPSNTSGGAYSKMTARHAVLDFLRSAGEPKSIREIINGLLAGGFQTTSKNFYTTLHTVLTKEASRPSTVLVKAPNKKWTVRQS